MKRETINIVMLCLVLITGAILNNTFLLDSVVLAWFLLYCYWNRDEFLTKKEDTNELRRLQGKSNR